MKTSVKVESPRLDPNPDTSLAGWPPRLLVEMTFTEDDGLVAGTEITGRMQTRKGREVDRSALIVVRPWHFPVYQGDCMNAFGIACG